VRRRTAKSTTSSVIELVVIVAVALLLALGIQAFIVKPYRIPSSSMEPTLNIGQRVLVNRIGTHFSGPHVGEIAVFHPPRDAQSEVCGQAHATNAVCQYPERQESSQNFIKRIVAGPGDVVTIRMGHVYRNGKLEPDGYTRPCQSGDSNCNFPAPVRIPPGHWFMMGDNRGQSDDSRFWGPVPTKWIIGGAFATYWPPDRIGFL
jgi:signal peptidase I